MDEIKTEYFWWCPKCKRELGGYDVTNSEHCVDCGSVVQAVPVGKSYEELESALQSAREEITKKEDELYNKLNALLGEMGIDDWAGYDSVGSLRGLGKTLYTERMENEEERDTLKAKADRMQDAISKIHKNVVEANVNNITDRFAIECIENICVDAFKSPPAAPEKAECRWTFIKNGMYFKTECGFNHSPVEGNKHSSCIFCGKPIAEGEGICTKCNGTGHIENDVNRLSDEITCPYCDGSGRR